MQYLRNADIIKLYPVSKRAISNWVQAARMGRLDLDLMEVKGKFHIANTTKNTALIDELVERAKKYKNTRGHKVVTPKPEFYELYSRKQIFDIIANLEIHREVPRQYNYFDGGATYWDMYANRLWGEDGPNILNSTVELLHSNLGNIDRLLEGREYVNVVDIGPGNALPVKELLTHLLYETGVLARYVAVDISREMLEIARRNIKQWFGDKVAFEGHVRDITHERFDDILVEETLLQDANSRCNLVLLLGGTLANFRSPDDALKVVYNSMGRSDILLYTKKLDSPKTRRHFDFSLGDKIQPLAPQYKVVVDLLGIDDSLYDVEMGYDDSVKARYLQIRLRVALSLVFKFEQGMRQVDLDKGDSLLVWRARHQTAHDIINQFEATGFALLQASATQDRDYILVAADLNKPDHSRA